MDYPRARSGKRQESAKLSSFKAAFRSASESLAVGFVQVEPTAAHERLRQLPVTRLVHRHHHDGPHHMPAIPDRNAPKLLDCAGAGLRVHAHNAATVVCISGEIDAANADRVGEAIRRFSRRKAPLILNLSRLDFLGVAGFRALIALNDEHRQARLPSSVVTGAVVRRVAGVFPDHGLPIVDSVPEALSAHGKGRRPTN
jgi:anti-anti-sigma factor